MIDRQKVEAVLTRRFPGARREQIAAAANLIMGLSEEWEEVQDHDAQLWDVSVRCRDTCYLARALEHGSEFRLFRRCASQ